MPWPIVRVAASYEPPQRPDEADPPGATHLRRRLAFVLLTLILALLAIEVAARLLLTIAEPPLAELRRERAAIASGEGSEAAPIGARGGELRNPVVLHPYLGFVREAMDRNEHGLLGPDPLGADPGDYNVALVGGSVAANLYLDLASELERGIAESSHAEGRRVRVFSLAVGAWRQPQQTLAVAYFNSLGVRMDLVINLDGFNEIAVAPGQAGRHSILYPRFWPELTSHVRTGEEGERIGRITQLRSVRQGLARSTSGRALGRLASVGILWRGLDRFLAARLAHHRAGVIESNWTLAPFQRGHGGSLTSDEAIDRMAELWLTSSIALDALQRAVGNRYLHVLQPNQYVVGSKTLTNEERRDAFTPDVPFARFATSGYRALRARAPALAEQGVDFLDATSVFSAVDETLYTDNCCHFNRRGNEILLGRIVAHLARFGGARTAPLHERRGR